MGGTLSFDIEGENPQHSYHKNSSFGFYFGAISGWSSYVAFVPKDRSEYKREIFNSNKSAKVISSRTTSDSSEKPPLPSELTPAPIEALKKLHNFNTFGFKSEESKENEETAKHQPKHHRSLNGKEKKKLRRMNSFSGTSNIRSTLLNNNIIIPESPFRKVETIEHCEVGCSGLESPTSLERDTPANDSAHNTPRRPKLEKDFTHSKSHISKLQNHDSFDSTGEDIPSPLQTQHKQQSLPFITTNRVLKEEKKKILSIESTAIPKNEIEKENSQLLEYNNQETDEQTSKRIDSTCTSSPIISEQENQSLYPTLSREYVSVAENTEEKISI